MDWKMNVSDSHAGAGRVKKFNDKVEVDFLAAEYRGTGRKHRTQSVQDIRARKVRACDLVFQEPVEITIEGYLPNGGEDMAQIRVAAAVPFLMMKRQDGSDQLLEIVCVCNTNGGF
jgi:hypothetical protein